MSPLALPRGVWKSWRSGGGASRWIVAWLLNQVLVRVIQARLEYEEHPQGVFNSSSQRYVETDLFRNNVVWQSRRPNIIFVMADDLGWNDVGWNPYSRVKTPTLTKLAAKGVILSNSYTLPKCAPSRYAFMTGRHPIYSGFQATNARPDQPIGAPLDTPLFSNVMKKLGYETHLIGKWHLGFCNWSYTPTERGFDSFFGFYGGSTDHYVHWKLWNKMLGYDLRSNKEEVHEQFRNRFSAHIFTKHALRVIRKHDRSRPLFLVTTLAAPHAPMQAPIRYRRLYRRQAKEGWSAKEMTYAAMVTAVDTAIARIVSMLKKRKMLENSILIFTSDNGAFAPASNYPLRGTKSTLFEGGTRVPTMVYSPLLQKHGYVNTDLFHSTDWLPTLASIAGAKPEDIPHNVDGMDASQSLLAGMPSPRQEVLYNVERNGGRYKASIRDTRWKLLIGSWKKIRAGWGNDIDVMLKAQHPIPLRSLLNPSGVPWNTSASYSRIAQQAGLENTDLSGPYWIGTTPYSLFDLKEDPCEKINLLHYRGSHDDQFTRLWSRLQVYMSKTHDDVVKATKPTRLADPRRFNGSWSPGWC
eukprot:scpid54939/ scgid12937/ Arylsulfatase J